MTTFIHSLGCKDTSMVHGNCNICYYKVELGSLFRMGSPGSTLLGLFGEAYSCCWTHDAPL